MWLRHSRRAVVAATAGGALIAASLAACGPTSGTSADATSSAAAASSTTPDASLDSMPFGSIGGGFVPLPGGTVASVPVGAGQTVTVPVAGHAGVPASGAGAVALAVAEAGPAGSRAAGGSVTVYPADGSQPDVPSVSWPGGQAASELAMSALSGAGAVAVRNASGRQVTVTLDADGYWLAGTPAAAGAFGALTGGRVARVLVGGGQTVTVPVAGHAGVPASGAGTVALTAAVASSFGTGSVTVYPAGARRAGGPSLSWAGGGAASGLVVSALSSRGTVALHNSSFLPVTVTLDATGYWLSGAPAAPGTFGPAGGERVARVVVGAGQTVPVLVAGHAGVPASGAGAAALAVRVAAGRSAGSVTVYPAGDGQPDVPSLSWAAGVAASALAVSALSSDGTVAVHNSSTRPVTVTLAAVGYWLSQGRTVSDVTAKPTTVTLTGSDVTAVSGDPAAAETVTLAAGVPVPAVGRVLTAPVSATAPDGLLGTVTAVAAGTGGTHVVTLSPATLDQAYSTFDVSTSQALTNSDVVQAPGGSAGQTQSIGATPMSAGQEAAPSADPTSGFGFNISKAAFTCKGSGDSTITLTADLSKINVDLSLNANPSTPSIHLLITADPVFDINVDFTGTVTCELADAHFLQAHILIPATPGLMVDLNPVLTLDAHGDVSIDFQWDPRAALGFDKGPGINSEVHGFGSSGNVAIKATADADLYMGLHADISLAGRVGVGGDFGPDLPASYDSGTGCVTVDGRAKADLTASADVFVKSWSFTLASGTFDERQLFHACGLNGLPPLAISDNLPGGTVGTPYTGTVSATGGSAPYTFTLASGSLPDGLSLSSAGAVSGTPTSAGSFPITVKVTDSAGSSATGSYTITVGDPGSSSGPGGPGGSGDSGGSDGTGWAYSQGALPANGTEQAELTGVSCPSATQCTVVGNTLSGSLNETRTPFLLTGSGQSWAAELAPVPTGTDMTNYTMGAVACPSASTCVAVGAGEFVGDDPVKYGAVVLTGSAGSWTATQVHLPADIDTGMPLTISGVSCPSVSLCFASGTYQDSTVNHKEHGLLLEWSNGSWTATEAPLPSDVGSNDFVELTGVSCPSVSLCFATGTYDAERGVLLTWSGGSWTAATAPMPSDAHTSAEIASDLLGISCPSASKCVAVGYYVNTTGVQDGLLLTWSGGSWTAAGAPPAGSGGTVAVLAAVSCASPTQCTALGRASSDVALETLSGGSWTATTLSLPSDFNTGWGNLGYDLGGISCGTASQCVAVGDYTDTSDNVDELLTAGPG
jgi:hypothetical protein